jgi:spore germination cell wall hydrolase CwlJ-like protein
MTQTLALPFARPRAARLWRDYPREAVGMAILGFAAIGALANAAWATPTLEGLRSGSVAAQEAPPPAPPPLLVREIAPEDALAINGTIPLESGPNPAARPFTMAGASEADRAQALDCLSSAVYYEAGSQDADGQRAVAQVVLNRVRHPAFPASVCGVVFQGSTRSTGCQFTFTCDGSLERRPSTEGWTRARKIAEAALNGYVFSTVGYATHYHADYVVPYWASSLAKNAVIGAHIFYRWAGGWGRPRAFAQAYSRHEPSAQALRSAALVAEATAPVEGAIADIPGAEALATDVTKDGDRLAIRFNLTARKAVEEAAHVPYVEKVDASDNLRWSLGGGGPVMAEQPALGAQPAAKTVQTSATAALPGAAATVGTAAAALQK